MVPSPLVIQPLLRMTARQHSLTRIENAFQEVVLIAPRLPGTGMPSLGVGFSPAPGQWHGPPLSAFMLEHARSETLPKHAIPAGKNDET